MDVYCRPIIVLCVVSGILSRNSPNLMTPEEKAICGDRYHFIDEKKNYTESVDMCLDLGYDGLAVIIRREQEQSVDDILVKESADSKRRVWVAYEYLGPNLHDWGWKRNGAWLNLSSEFPIMWGRNEPDMVEEQRCGRVATNFAFRWRSKACSEKFQILCQKYEIPSYRESQMKVYLSNRKEPNGTDVYKTTSVFQCLSLCLDKCTCKFTYHYGNACHVITGNDDILISDYGLGTYYQKVSWKSIY